jgi:hypothetical protein
MPGSSPGMAIQGLPYGRLLITDSIIQILGYDASIMAASGELLP